jgi:threonine dehydrogenase-like Zn-dependent dehydrogenase
MGLMNLELAKRAGAATLSMIDLNPTKLETAKLLGCSAAVTNADELDRLRGWDVVIDCTGVVAAIEDAIRRVGKGGTFRQFGVTDHGAQVKVDPYRIYNEEITITGSMAVLHSFERAGELFADGILDPDIFISHRLPLAEYENALGLLGNGVGRKIQVVPGLEAAVTPEGRARS